MLQKHHMTCNTLLRNWNSANIPPWQEVKKWKPWNFMAARKRWFTIIYVHSSTVMISLCEQMSWRQWSEDGRTPWSRCKGHIMGTPLLCHHHNLWFQAPKGTPWSSSVGIHHGCWDSCMVGWSRTVAGKDAPTQPVWCPTELLPGCIGTYRLHVHGKKRRENLGCIQPSTGSWDFWGHDAVKN